MCVVIHLRMAKTFRSWEVDQGWLLPASVHEIVPAGHQAHFFRDAVQEGLDLSAILDTEERVSPGSKARHSAFVVFHEVRWATSVFGLS